MVAPAPPLRIPLAPRTLVLPITRHWNGRVCADPRRHATVSLSAASDALVVEARGTHQRRPRVPSTRPGRRVRDLWRYDVVECFLAGEGGRYLEIELGPGGHFLLLSFSAPRVRCARHEDVAPSLATQRGRLRWRSRLALPWSLVPRPLVALNAFAIAGPAHLAYAPVPGEVPDFHQPQAFPRVTLEEPAPRADQSRLGASP